jgi:hypothetical protein
MKIIKSLSKEFPEFRELLLKTGDSRIVYANIEEPIFGVGLVADDPEVEDPAKWRGKNLWGQALEDARTEFRQENVVEKTEEEGIREEDLKPVDNEVISKSQQDAAKKAAIMNAKRFQKRY